jgi:hypothetical protein
MMNCLFLEASSSLIFLWYRPIVEEYSSLCFDILYYWWLADNRSSYYLCIATKNDCYSAFNTILSDWTFSYLTNLSFKKEGESFGLYYVTTDQEWLMNIEMGEQITRSPSWGMWSTTRRSLCLHSQTILWEEVGIMWVYLYQHGEQCLQSSHLCFLLQDI